MAENVIKRPHKPADTAADWELVHKIEVAYPPDIDHLITEDDTPVDNAFSEKQQRLLVEPLYTTWAGGPEQRPFLAQANVGIFNRAHNPPIVPDMLLSLDVEAADDLWAKVNRSYLIWEFGKPPDVVVEIVSNLEGNEAGRKMQTYARIRVSYYVIFDPQKLLANEPLRLFELRGSEYSRKPDTTVTEIGLSLVLWEGVFEQSQALWLRWADTAGNLIPTGAELAAQERARAERLAEQLRALGVEPEA
jgi:Uma2 family endonuclease